MSERQANRPSEGWSTLCGQSRKRHYFRDGLSLCCGWGHLGSHFGGMYLEAGDDKSPDKCAICLRKRLKEIKAGREAGK